MKKFFACVFIAALLTGCAPTFNYNNLDSLMKTGDCAGSVDLVKKSKSQYGGKAELLYLLDSAMVNLACNNYKVANRYFHDAEEMAAGLWTKSISQETAAMLTNDLIVAYPGEDFERAMINLFSAFTYIKLDNFDDALIECKRLDTLLNEYNRKYDKKNVYKEDALGRYISGILSEADGEYSDAYIYYYEAFNAFREYSKNYGTPMPGCLVSDLLRVAAPADKKKEAKALVRGIKKTRYQRIAHKEAQKLGKIVFLHFNGKAPVKVEKKFTHRSLDGPVSIAFPQYVATPPTCRNSKLILKSNTGTINKKTVLVENINKIAEKNLADRKARIWAKTIARAVLKQAAAKAAAQAVKKEYGEFAGMIAHLGGKSAASATEKADTRVWRTLPGEIYISRVFVPEGRYEVAVEECSGNKTNLDTVSIKAGKTRFVFHNSMY